MQDGLSKNSRSPDKGVLCLFDLRERITGNPTPEKAPKKRRSEPAKAAEPRRSGPDTGQDAPVKSVNSRECIYSKLGETEKKVFDALPDEGAVTSDKLSSTGLPASEVLAALTVLELYAAVESLPGGLHRKIV